MRVAASPGDCLPQASAKRSRSLAHSQARMNRIITHLVNQFAVQALARNRAFQAFVVRAVDSVKNAGESVTKATSTRSATEAPRAAHRHASTKIKPEIPESAASASSASPAVKPSKPVDPRDKGFFGHLADVVAKDISDTFGRR